jgi:hypothetical protein
MIDPLQTSPAYYKIDDEEFGEFEDIGLARTIRGGSCKTEQFRPHLHLVYIRLGEPMWANEAGDDYRDGTDGFRIVRNR